MAALANGGSADDIAPGVEFFKQLNEAGNLLPVDPTPATIASGQTPMRHRLGVQQRRPDRRAGAAKGVDWQVVIPSDAPPVAAYYIQAINKEAPHPAAARCWEEYLYSPEGQNTWLKGYARPVLPGQADRGRHDRPGGARRKLAPTAGTPVQLNAGPDRGCPGSTWPTNWDHHDRVARTDRST